MTVASQASYAAGSISVTNIAKGEEARYLALTNMAMAGGSALARLIGPAIDFFNEVSAGLGYKVMLLVCLTCFVVGALLIIKIKPASPTHG